MSHNIPAPKPRVLYLASQVDQGSINTISSAIIDINTKEALKYKIIDGVI